MISRVRSSVVLSVVALATMRVASADTIFLKPRGQIDGKVVGEEGDAYSIRLPAGGTTLIDKRRVLKIRIDSDTTAPAALVPPADEPPSKREPQRSPDRAKAPAPTRSEAVPSDADASLVPACARIGGSCVVEEAGSVSPGFRAGLDAMVKAPTTLPEALAAWIKEKGKRAQDRAYVLRVMQTWTDEAQRRLLWKAWVKLDDPQRAEERLLPFAGSDIEVSRLDGCWILRDHATWTRSGALVLKLLDVPHQPSQEAGHGLIESLARRDGPVRGATARALVDRFKKANDPAVKDWYGRSIRTLASVENGRALVAALENEYASARVEGKIELLPFVLCGQTPTDAHARLLSILQDPSSDPALSIVAIRELPRFGGAFADIPLLLPFLDVDAKGHGARAANPLRDTVITAVAVFGQHARFGSADALTLWWKEVSPAFYEQGALIPMLSKGEEEAATAIHRLAPIFTPEVTAALRAAARRAADARTRVNATQTLVVRKDRKAVGAILDALRSCDGDDRATIVRALRALAKSDEVPADPTEAASWWRERFPEDVTEE